MLRVKDWDLLFENSRTRGYGRLGWVPIPNKHDSDGYTQLIEHEHGASHYGAWCLIVQVASKCKPRGTLIREGGTAHDASSLARITRIGAHVFREAIPRFLEIGWLENIDDCVIGGCQATDGVLSAAQTTEKPPSLFGDGTCGKVIGGCQATVIEKKRKEKKGTEQNKSMSADADDSATDSDDGQLRDWLRWWNALHEDGMVSAGVNEERPSEAVRKAWKRCQQNREIRELLARRAALEDRIRKSTFCREGWFRLEKLFGAKNRDGELIVRKLLEGGYGQRRAHEAPTENGLEACRREQARALEELRKESGQ
ncbi:MAG: hypothetical protein JXB10_09090 [Pirellulales bacterium]|nr:hypothetical protein [Pirellulales bacterium]